MNERGKAEGEGWRLRPETLADAPAIRMLTAQAFAPVTHSSQSEAAIVDALRAAGALTLSLVAETAQGLVGHVAFSPVTIEKRDCGWFGLGPLSVLPEMQRRGIGAGLVREGLARLAGQGAKGCVVLGNPAYYGRFGFSAQTGLRYPGAPPHAFQSLLLAGVMPEGVVAYHAGFAAR